MHPAHRVKAIERAMPSEQTRGQHPNCSECGQPARFTLVIDTGSGQGFRHLCREDLRKELAKDSELSSQVLVAFIEQQLPRQLESAQQIPLARG